MILKYLLGLAVAAVSISAYALQEPSMALTYQKDIEAGTLSLSNATSLFDYYKAHPDKFPEIAESLMKNSKVILRRAEEANSMPNPSGNAVGQAVGGLLILTMFYNHGPQFVKQFEEAQNGELLGGFCKMLSAYFYREKEPLAQKFGFPAAKALLEKNFAAAVALQKGDVQAQPLVAFPVLQAYKPRAHAPQMPTQLTYDFQP